MEFLKTPRGFAMELADLNGNSASAAMETFFLHLKTKATPGVGAAWTAEVLIELAKMREQGLLSA